MENLINSISQAFAFRKRFREQTFIAIHHLQKVIIYVPPFTDESHANTVCARNLELARFRELIFLPTVLVESEKVASALSELTLADGSGAGSDPQVFWDYLGNYL